MVNRYFKMLLLAFCAGGAVYSPVQLHAQLSSGSSAPSFDTEGLRYADINEIIDRTYLRDSTYTFTFQEEKLDGWLLKEKVVYDYDNQGREIFREYFSNRDGLWKPFKQMKSKYISDFLAIEEEYSRDETNQSYVLSIKREFDYNYVGLLSEIIASSHINAGWLAQKKLTYSYNNEYLISEQSSFEWNAGKSSWDKASRYVYTYNEYDDVKDEIFQVWDDSLQIWKNQSSKVYKYDQSNNLISTTKRKWDRINKIWSDISVLSIQYNEDGRMLGSAQQSINQFFELTPSQSEIANYDEKGNVEEIVKSTWDETSGMWDEYQKQVHFWSVYNHGNLSGNSSDIGCFFSNPYTIGLPVYCSSLKEDVLYTVTIYDLNGRFYYSDQFSGSSSFRIKRYIEPGFYIMNISGGLDSHSEKVFIKN